MSCWWIQSNVCRKSRSHKATMCSLTKQLSLDVPLVAGSHHYKQSDAGNYLITHHICMQPSENSFDWKCCWWPDNTPGSVDRLQWETCSWQLTHSVWKLTRKYFLIAHHWACIPWFFSLLTQPTGSVSYSYLLSSAADWVTCPQDPSVAVCRWQCSPADHASPFPAVAAPIKIRTFFFRL